MSTDPVKVYDAEQMVVGRLGAKVAKAALLGENVIIVNAEKAVITGDPRTLINAWNEKSNIRTSYNPKRGPFHDRRPDKMVQRNVTMVYSSRQGCLQTYQGIHWRSRTICRC